MSCGRYRGNGHSPQPVSYTHLLDRVMEIWLSGNRQAHPFVDPSYWERHWEEVREAVPQSQILAWTEEDDIVAFLGLSLIHI